MKQSSPLPTGMAFKYETAYNQLFDAAPNWIQELVIEEPLERHSTALAHQAAILAEKGEITARETTTPMKFDPKYMINKQQVEVSGKAK
tara:strand:- start:867 stop:1133 length:267 start_codon:yes stop_codon:yes gene_type:complete